MSARYPVGAGIVFSFAAGIIFLKNDTTGYFDGLGVASAGAVGGATGGAEGGVAGGVGCCILSPLAVFPDAFAFGDVGEFLLAASGTPAMGTG